MSEHSITTNVVFYHAWSGGMASVIIPEQLQRLVESGLYESASRIFVGITSDNQAYLDLFKGLPKLELVQVPRDKWELGTLSLLHKYAKAYPKANILYMHTKAASKFFSTTNDWRLLMEHFTISKFERCTKLLTSHDAVGINLHTEGNPHFSGNFWWARGSYIATLPDPLLCEGKAYDARMHAEFWLLSGAGSFCSVYNSGVNHYLTPYPKYQYQAENTDSEVAGVLRRPAAMEEISA